MFKNFPSMTSIVSDGNTAFLRAARAGHLDKVLEHLKNNVDINTSNTNGLNALHLASKDGHIDVVTELLKRGANVDSATKKGNTALHIASLAGQEEVVKLLVENGASVNVQSQNGFTPLYMAAQENHDSVVKFLLASNANQSLATEDGFTPLAVAMQQGHDKVVAVLLENDSRGKVRLPALHIAAKKDDCKAAALLLQNEHNPDVTSKSGFTPLHIASHYGNEGIAQLLLSKGADVNFSAKHNITPLHVAAKWGKTNMVALLLDRGANIEAKTRDGLTPLHCAARSGHEQVVDMLLERGAPISAKTKNGLAPLHMASQGDHVDAARILLYHRAPVDDVTVDYLTALHVAAHCGHVSVARLLLDRKADPNARALNGFTPLHIASKKNRIKVVELLLKHGASIEATTESGLTPLHVASFMGCMNIVIYLVQNEANPDVTTVRGETPLHLAARANQTDIIRILLRNGAQVDARAREQQTPLHIASRLGNVDIVMLLLQHGANVDSTTKDLYTALHITAKEGQEEVAGVLLEHGASLEATTKKGFTPLHLAAKYGNIKVAKLLLQRDAPVDAQGKNGVTPLHVASHYDHQNVALLLLEKGASPHATAKNGHTPLHIAARKNQMDIATTLIEYGAKAETESKAGFTPLHLAAQEGHADMANLLLDHNADPNHKAKNGLTPLHLCAQEDRVEVGSILIKNGAEKDAVTKAGYTPLHVACHFGQTGMVRLLLAEGASVRPTTAVNYTPLHQASQQGHSAIVTTLLQAGADPNATTNQGQTALSIAQKLGYISVVETLKGVTEPTSQSINDEKYKVVAPETMQETFMSDSEDEGGEDTALNEQPYHYLTVDEMKTLGDDSLPIDVTRDETADNRENMGPPTAIDDTITPQHIKETYTQYSNQYSAIDNVEVSKHPQQVGFLVSFLVDARGGAMRGCRHSGVRMIVPPRRASMPIRVTCRYLKRDKMAHPPPLMEGEALASRILELGPVGAKFLGPVMIVVPHFASLRGKEREIVILRSDNGETWREHTFDSSDEAVQEVINSSFEKEEASKELEDGGSGERSRVSRILMTELPHYLAVVSRIKQEVHAIGPEGGMVSSTVVPQVQAVFPQGALTKKIKVGLQAQPIPAELTAKLLGNRVAVSPIVTVEPRRRKFHKPITLTIPVPQAANKGMINTYSGDAPTLRLLCSITGGTTRAQWEDVTGSTPLTFVNDCVSFTTTVSARFWLIDCRNVSDATRMATELYKEAIHVPFMAKFVVFAKRNDVTEARLRVFCMTDDKEDKTLENQENFTEVAKSRDVEVLEGKTQFVEFAGNLVPITKSGDQLQLGFSAFKENRLPFTVRVRDPHADPIGRILFMREPKVSKGDVPQQPICILNIVLPDNIVPEPNTPDHEGRVYISHSEGVPSWQRLSEVGSHLGDDWVRLASHLDVSNSHVEQIKSDYSTCSSQASAMLKHWVQDAGNKASGAALEEALRNIGRFDIVQTCLYRDDDSHIEVTNITGSYQSRIYGDKSQDTIYSTVKTKEINQVETTIMKHVGPDVHDKDDKEEKKYSAEEKEVDESEVKRSVTERKREIERRISEESDPVKRRETTPSGMAKVSSSDAQKKDSVESRHTLMQEKEVSEEKSVSPEPANLPFDQKRLSFELGTIAAKEIHKKVETLQDSRTSDSFEAAPEQVKEEEPLSFAEKRLSFEKGLPLKKVAEEKKLDSKVEVMEQEIITTKEISKVEKTVEQVLSDDVTPKVTGKGSDKSSIVKGASKEHTPMKEGARPILSDSKLMSFDAANTNLKDVWREEDGDTKPIPSPRAMPPSKSSPTLPQDQEPEEAENYLVKKNFWENLTSCSTGDASISVDRNSGREAPVPKPRLSISISQPSEDESSGLPKTNYSETSVLAEPLVIEEIKDGLQSAVSAMSRLASEHTDECTESQEVESESEAEYDCKEHLAYDNSAFVEEDEDEIEALPNQTAVISVPSRKPVERSVSLPCGPGSVDESDDSVVSVRERKKLFEEKIKKEIIVEQLMTQVEEESPPEHKAIEKFEERSSPGDAESASTQIQTHIFKHELEEQTEPSVPESKELITYKVCDITQKTDVDCKMDNTSDSKEMKLTKENLELKDTLETRSGSSCSNSSLSKRSDISSGAAEILQYKTEIISKPSDSLEVHIDKSELEENEKAKDFEDEDKFEGQSDIGGQSMDLITNVDVRKSLKGSRSSSQGESEDTLSESDVTPEDIRFKEQIILTEWEKDVKNVEGGEAASIQVYTPEEHIPDTVWEVPVQQEISEIEEVQTIASTDSLILNDKHLTENHDSRISEEEAHRVAVFLMDDIEEEISKQSFPSEPIVPVVDSVCDEENSKSTDGEATRRRIESLMNFTRADTATSSMDITDEELRSSGVETDVSPLESQAGRLLPLEDVSEADSIGELELEMSLANVSTNTVLISSVTNNVNEKQEKSILIDNNSAPSAEVIEKTLAEVRESLEAVKEELIEEKKKKKDSITKESPSEFEIKGLILERPMSESSIKEYHLEESLVSSDSSKVMSSYLEDSTIKKSPSGSNKVSFIKNEEVLVATGEFSDDMERLIDHETQHPFELSVKNSEYSLPTGAIPGNEKLIEELDYQRKESPKLKMDNEALLANNICTASGEYLPSGMTEESPDISDCDMVERPGLSPDISEASGRESIPVRPESTHKETAVSIQNKIDSNFVDNGKVPYTSDTSEKSDGISSIKSEIKETAILITSSTLDLELSEKTDSSITKAEGNVFGKVMDPKSDYSSSGESHYHSFDQNSDSGQTNSRPCSSDVEGLLANIGITGSSEYESAISHAMSTTVSSAVSSKDFQTAVSSLSSRDSMKSLDSESSGNLASMSSEASETLVPSAMELERDMELLSRSFTIESEPVTGQSEDTGYVAADLMSEIKSTSDSREESVDVSEDEGASEEETPDSVNHDADYIKCMKRSHEMTFHPEPRSIESAGIVTDFNSQEDKAFSSLDDVASSFSDITVIPTAVGGDVISSHASSRSVIELTNVEESSNEEAVSRTPSISSVECKADSLETSPSSKKRPGHKRNGSTIFVASSTVSVPPNLPNIKDDEITEEEPHEDVSESSEVSNIKKISVPDIFHEDTRIDDELLEVLADRKSPISASPFERPESPEPEDFFGDISKPSKFVYDYEDEGDPFSEGKTSTGLIEASTTIGTSSKIQPIVSETLGMSRDQIPGIKISETDDSEFLVQEIKDISLPPTPVSVSSKTSSETESDKRRDSSVQEKHVSIEHGSDMTMIMDEKEPAMQFDDVAKVDEQSVLEMKLEGTGEVGGGSQTDSPMSDSFEMLEKPDISDEFVIIEEVGKEADEQDREGKGLRIAAGARRAPETKAVSPPKTDTKMTKIKYFSEGGTEITGAPFDMEAAEGESQQSEHNPESSSQEGSPPSDNDVQYDQEIEANKKWIEMQFQGEPAAAVYGYGIELGPLEDIKEEEITDLENSSKIGSMGSQVSHSIGSFGSMKESLSSTPDYDVLAGKKYFSRSGEHDDVSMSSLQEFERIERLITMESSRTRSSGSQDSLTSSSNSKKSKKSGGDDLSLASLKEFEGLETACNEAVKIEKKARLEEESLLSEIEEGHESQASESESCITISAINKGESEEEDYDNRMFEIEEIIKQAQANVDKDPTEILKMVTAAKTTYSDKYDSMEEVAKVPDLDLDKPFTYSVQTSSIFEKVEDDLLTSTESLEFRTQISKIGSEMFDSTDSLEPKSLGIGSISDSSGRGRIKSDKKQAESITEWQEYEEIEGAVSPREEDNMNRMPPPRAEYALGSSDSLEPTSSAATHATYQYETDSLMSSSFTSGDSNTMVSSTGGDLDLAARAWFDDGKPYVTEVIEPGDDEFSHIIHRTVEMPPEIRKVTFRGNETEVALQEYIEKFDPGEDMYETQEIAPDGTVHIKRVVQKRVFLTADDMEKIESSGTDIDTYVKQLTKETHQSYEPLAKSHFSSPKFESHNESKSSSSHKEFSYAKEKEEELTKEISVDRSKKKT